MDRKIKENREKLENTKSDPELAQYMTTQLHKTIKDMIDLIKSHNILDTAEKQWRLNQFSDYLFKMKYINAECFFEKPTITQEKGHTQR